MEKTHKIALYLGAALLSNSVFAGSMGPISVPFSHTPVPFVSAEGFPVWIKFGGIKVIRNQTVNSADSGTFTSGGARVAGGIIYPYQPNWDLTSELGWNYFGQTSGSVSDGSISASLYGVDILLGAAYKIRNYEIFGKVGALFERADFDLNIPSTYAFTTNSLNYYVAAKTNSSVTEVLPEIKVGVNYNVNQKLAVTVAYMHAFGSSPHATISSINPDATTLNAAIDSNLKAPTLDAAMFGVRYQFIS